MHWLDWLIALVPFSLILFAAMRSGRYVRGVADFLAAGRCAGRYVICVGDVASSLSIITLVASCEQNYQVGYALNFWGAISAPIGLFLSLTGFCIYRFRATRALSFGQFLEMRYNRQVRIVAATIRNLSEMVTNAIGPAIAASFFVHILGLPFHFVIFGHAIPTATVLIAFSLVLALLCIWPGGRVSLLVTDCAQGILMYPIFVVFTVFVLVKFSWFQEIAPTLADRVPGESFLNPFDIGQLRKFNAFSVFVTIFSSILNRASWYGNDATNCGRTPHENKMAGILGSWRNGFAYTMITLFAIMMIAFMNHRRFADEAHVVRQTLSRRITEELVQDKALRRKADTAIAGIPCVEHVIGQNPPLSQRNNLDTPYPETFRKALGDAPGAEALVQRYANAYRQMMLPTMLRSLFPVGLCGLFCLLMLMLLVSTDDSRIFNATGTIVQDCILPFRKTPWTTQEHVRTLRWTAVGVAVFFFVVASFFQNLDFINMFTTIMTSLWLGGAGPIMIGGLYTRFGNTTGAVCSLVFGCGSSLVGLVTQRNWADHLYPFFLAKGWIPAMDRFLVACSRPFHPLISWRIDPANPGDFPINSYEIYFLSMVLSILAYVIGSLVTYKEPFNLDRMLHRGIYATGDDHTTIERLTWRNVFRKLIGIDSEYTTGDKAIAWLVFLWTFVYRIGLCFLLPIILHLTGCFGQELWSWRFFIVSLCVSTVVGVVSTVWFMWGGIRDGRRLFRDLAARADNPLDDGTVEGHVSRADLAAFAEKRAP